MEQDFQNEIPINEIKYIAGFDVAFNEEECICSVAVLEFKTLNVVEKKTLTSKTTMKYIPGLQGLREGPVICQLYYDLEYEPDVILVKGHGIDQEGKNALATFLSEELAKPIIGVSKSKDAQCDEREGVLLRNGVEVGKVIQTREYANPLYVSPGFGVSIKSACEIISKCIVPPHKLPEPLHKAQKIAKKGIKEKIIIEEE